MTCVNANNSRHNITTGKVLTTIGLCSLPILSIGGDVIDSTIKNHRVDKTPLKDSFTKAVRNTGEKTQKFLPSLKKFSSTKIGAIALALGTTIDVLLTYWCVDKISKKLKKK